MQSPDLPKSVTFDQVLSALEALGIDHKGRRVTSVAIGINEVAVYQIATNAEGRPYIDTDGNVARDVNLISVERGD